MITVFAPNEFAGLSYTVPDAYLGMWVTMEAWVYVSYGEAGLSATAPPRNLASSAQTRQWVRLVASMRPSGAQKTFQLTSWSATVPDTVFYVGAVNVWAETAAYDGSDGTLEVNDGADVHYILTLKGGLIVDVNDTGSSGVTWTPD